jgi:hypothetical protein
VYQVELVCLFLKKVTQIFNYLMTE